MSELEVSDFAPCIWHRNLRNLNAQLHGFTVNPRCAPKGDMLSSTYSSLCRPLVYVEQSNGAGERSALVQRERST
jgi:hypothetical protein